MLLCYLDDSGTDSQNPIVTCAGYASTAARWEEFESEVEPIFQKYNVTVLHSVDLANTKGVFKDWSVIRKHSFLAQICTVLSRHAVLGMSMSAEKEKFRQRANESDRKRTVTPYTFCAGGILNWAMTDIRLGGLANNEGLGFVFEAGNKNDNEVAQYIESLRPLHSDLAKILAPTKFISKSECRAVQMADMFAYYSRRHAAQILRLPPADREKKLHNPDDELKIIVERLPHRPFIATDFGPNAVGSQFFSERRPISEM